MFDTQKKTFNERKTTKRKEMKRKYVQIFHWIYQLTNHTLSFQDEIPMRNDCAGPFWWLCFNCQKSPSSKIRYGAYSFQIVCGGSSIPLMTSYLNKRIIFNTLTHSLSLSHYTKKKEYCIISIGFSSNETLPHC